MLNEENQSDGVACHQCATIPENYVKLDCAHKFCLLCLAYMFLEQEKSNSNITIQCALCQLKTELDSETFTAIKIVIEEVIIPFSQQNEKSPAPIPKQESAQKKPFQSHQYPQTSPWTQKSTSPMQQIDYSEMPLSQKQEFYLNKLNDCLVLKIATIKNLQQEKIYFQQQNAQIRDSLYQEFLNLEKYLSEAKENYFHQLNQIEMNYMRSLKESEENQEICIQQIQMLREDLNVIASSKVTSTIEQQANLNRLLHEIDELTDNRILNQNESNPIDFFTQQLLEFKSNKNSFFSNFQQIITNHPKFMFQQSTFNNQMPISISPIKLSSSRSQISGSSKIYSPSKSYLKPSPKVKQNISINLGRAVRISWKNQLENLKSSKQNFQKLLDPMISFNNNLLMRDRSEKKLENSNTIQQALERQQFSFLTKRQALGNK